MRTLFLLTAFVLVVLAGSAVADRSGRAAGRVPVTADYFDGTKRVITLAAESPRKRYRLTVAFADDGQRVVRWMHSGETKRIQVGNRPHSLAIRCIPKKKRRR